MSDTKVGVSATLSAEDKATATIQKVGKQISGLQRIALNLSNAFKSMGGPKLMASFGKVGGALRTVGSRIMSLTKPLLGLVGIGSGFGMAEMISGMQSYVDRVRDLDRTAQVLGTTTTRLSGLQYAARRAGIDVEQFNNALVRGNQAMAKAMTGKGTDLTTLLAKLGISFKNADGSVRSIVDILPQFADAIARQKDPLLKTRMASALFGRALGPEMMKLLNQGSAGIAKFIEEAEKLGLIISPEQAKIAEQYAATQRQIGNLWESMGLQINQALLPVLQQIIPIFADLLKENREAIVKGLTDAFTALGDALKKIDWAKLITDIKEWGTWINDNIGYIGGWKVALGLLALAATGLLGPILALVPAFISLGIAMLTTPVGWFIAAIAAIAVAAFLIWKYWEPIKGFFADLFNAIKIQFMALRGHVQMFINDFVPQPIKDAWEGIKEFFTKLWNGDVKGAFDLAVTGLTNFVAQFIPKPVQDAWQGIKAFFETLLGGVEAAFKKCWDFIKPIVDSIAGAAGWVIDTVSKLPSPGSVAKGVAGAAKGAVNWVTGGGNSGPGVTSAGTIPQQATAGNQRVDVRGEIVNKLIPPPGWRVEQTETTRGPVAITGDVGASMAAPA